LFLKYNILITFERFFTIKFNTMNILPAVLILISVYLYSTMRLFFRQTLICRQPVVIITCINLLLLSSCSSGRPEWRELFSGTDLSGWVRTGGEATFEAVDKTIVGTSVRNTPNSFLTTSETFGDFILEYEFMVHPLLNSGVQIRSQSLPEYREGRVHGYQVEIDPSQRAWTAGIYDEARRGWLYPLSGPDHENARMAFRENEWNKVRVEAIGSHIKTWLNGVPAANLHDDETAEGFIALQVHSIGNDSSREGTQVTWRNIRILTENPEKYATGSTAREISFLKNKLTEKEVAEGWKLLFDGETSSGWRRACRDEFPEAGWRIEDGELTVLSSRDGGPRGGDIVTIDKYSDFDLVLQAKLTPVANSGVKYFVTEHRAGDRCSPLGPEYQVIDNNYPGLNEDQKMGALYDLKEAVNVRLNPVGQWNNIRILVNGSSVQHWLNGIMIVEYDRESEDFDRRVAASKFKDVPGYGKTGGHILLQEHEDEVSFRSIKIRRL
jgi:hypothetical protein